MTAVAECSAYDGGKNAQMPDRNPSEDLLINAFLMKLVSRLFEEFRLKFDGTRVN